MKHHTHIRIAAEAIAHSPRAIGLNVEMQDHHATGNLWDWVADSGATVIRSFHPEQSLRIADPDPANYPAGDDRAGFDAFRSRLLADPERTLPWNAFGFERHLPWMGVPDGFVDAYHAIDRTVLFSLGWLPTAFARPLLTRLEGPPVEPADDEIDWGAAACAYEYYLAVIWRYARRGGRYFLMCNEPENRDGGWHLPDDVARLTWAERFWDDETPGRGTRFLDLVTRQYAVCCRLARLALDDVAALEEREDLRLCGPTTVVWDALWRVAAPHCHLFDYHHYHPEPAAFPPMHEAARQLAGDTPMMISEFNRLSGGVDTAESPFVFSNALETARLLTTVLAMHRGPVPMEAITLYLLAFPSTHRNHKHLVYGDLNVADWSGRDTPLWDRGGEWYPRFDELQLRHPTPAYHVFRMLARHVDAAVHPVGLCNPSSSGPADSDFDLDLLATVHADGRVVVSIMNTSATDRPGVHLDTTALEVMPAQVVVRRLDRDHADQALASHTPGDGPIALDTLPAHSLTQVCCWPTGVGNGPPRLEEVSTTPGSRDGLALLQTTRLRALVDDVDITQRDLVFTSSHPELIRVGQGGLVQRLRDGAVPVTITACRLTDGAAATVVIPPSAPTGPAVSATAPPGATGPDAVGRTCG